MIILSIRKTKNMNCHKKTINLKYMKNLMINCASALLEHKCTYTYYTIKYSHVFEFSAY